MYKRQGVDRKEETYESYENSYNILASFVKKRKEKEDAVSYTHLSDEAFCQKLVRDALEKLGGLDILDDDREDVYKRQSPSPASRSAAGISSPGLSSIFSIQIPSLLILHLYYGQQNRKHPDL